MIRMPLAAKVLVCGVMLGLPVLMVLSQSPVFGAEQDNLPDGSYEAIEPSGEETAGEGLSISTKAPLEVVPPERVVDASAGETTFDIIADSAWSAVLTMQSAATIYWAYLVPDGTVTCTEFIEETDRCRAVSGVGNHSLRVAYDENMTNESRSAFITVTSEEKQNGGLVEVTLLQLGIGDEGEGEGEIPTEPGLQLIGPASINAQCGVPFVDPGYVVNDENGIPIVGVVVNVVILRNGTVYDHVITDPNDPDFMFGVEYMITYTVQDPGEIVPNVAVRTVTVVDTLPPAIILEGETWSIITRGDEYTEPGYIALDECEGDLTDDVVVVGEVDAETSGFYPVTYSVSDSSGNTTVVMRTVVVVGMVLGVDGNCEIEVPDFIEDYFDIFQTDIETPWPVDASLTQFPPPGMFAPLDIEEDDWLDLWPQPEGWRWPLDDVLVIVIAEGVGIFPVAVIRDVTPPQVDNDAPNLFQRVSREGDGFVMPDFRPRLRPFISDNCSPSDALIMSQIPPPGVYPLPGDLPAGRVVWISITDERGNVSWRIARIEVVDPEDTRPVIVPNGVNERDRQFEFGTCDFDWDCGLLAYWEDIWECGVPYDEPGAVAYDPVSGANLTPFVRRRVVDEDGNDIIPYTGPSSAGNTFRVRYWIGDEEDLASNGLVERRVTVVDRSAPVITLGAIGGGPSGAHTLPRNWAASAAPGWEEPDWVQGLRAMAGDIPWVFSLPLFNFEHQEWADETAMPWRCWGIEPYQEFLNVYDDCEGQFSQAKLDENVLVVIVRVRMDGAIYSDGEETFYAGGWLGDIRNAGLDLTYGRPATGRPNPWYGYRIYYFAYDDAGNLGYVSRHVNPLAGEGISLAEPTTITISCDGNGLQQLYDVERLDRAGSVCRGDITHLIRATGGIDMTPDGYYVPGTYYRHYTIEGGQIWPNPWRRTIIVEDTGPEVLMYNERGEEVFGLAESAIVVSWCEFLEYPGATPEAQAAAWAMNWWAAQPGYDPGDEELAGTFGYSVTHPCDDDIALTSWVDVRGLGVLQNVMLNYYQSHTMYAPADHLLGAYTLTYELQDPRHDLTRAIRPVFLLHDIDVDLIFSPVVEVEHEDEDTTIVRVECGTPFTLPEVGRIWDRCSGRALDYTIVPLAFDVAGNPIESPEDIDFFEPGIVRLVYHALVGAQEVPVPVRTVEVHLVDTTPPEIALQGEEVVELGCGDDYIEAFAIAFDLCDGDLTAEVMIGGDLGPYIMPGTYYRTYTVSDRSGNEAQIQREIRVVITETPEMTLLGDAAMTIECGQAFVDPGVFAYIEECDLDASAAVIVTGVIDRFTPGDYVLQYSLPGDWGAVVEPLQRTVTVVDTTPPQINVGPFPAWLEDLLVYDDDGFIRFECRDEFFDDPDNLRAFIQPDGFAAVDACVGDLGDVRVALEADEAGVMAWAWWLDDEGEPRWIFDIGDIRPDYVTYEELPFSSGDYLLLYEAHDGNGNWYPPRQSGENWPDIFGDDGRLDIRDEFGNMPDYARLVRIVDEDPPVLNMILDTTVDYTFECGEPYPFVGPEYYSAWDDCDGDITDRVHIAEPDMFTPGEYVVVYSITDRAGNTGNTESVTVIVEDNEPPAIELYWDTVPIEGNDASEIVECGVSVPFAYFAFDDCDGDISHLVVMVISDGVSDDYSLFDLQSRPGDYLITLNVTDRSGHIAEERAISVTVEDTEPPMINLSRPGAADEDDQGRYILDCGITWDEATHEPGYQALDRCEGDLTAAVVREIWAIERDAVGAQVVWDHDNDEPLNYAVEDILDELGEYLFVYRVSDSVGNAVPPVDEDGIPALFDDEGYLDIFDEDGLLDPSYHYLRWVVVGSRIPPDLEVVFQNVDAAGFVNVECGIGVLETPAISAVDLCEGDLSDTVERWIWAYNPFSGIETTNGLPVNYEEEASLGRPGQYVFVYAATNSVGVSQPPMNADGLPDIYDETMHLVVELPVPYLQQVRVRDTLSPTITLVDGDSVDLPYGQEYVEPGYAALDDCDGDITDNVQVSGNVDSSRLGEYVLEYTVVDSQGNMGSATRVVRVLDPIQPEITLIGEAEIVHECGIAYKDDGATARDAASGQDMSDAIVVTGLSEDLGLLPGMFTITYRVASPLGANVAEAVRILIVEDNLPPDLQLRGPQEVTVDCGATYVDEGVLSAYDQCDGNMMGRVNIAGAVDTASPGEYIITFSVSDRVGNEAVVTRTVTVLDNCKIEPEGEEEGEIEGEPMEGEGEIEGEPDDCRACRGCRGCDDDDKDAVIERMKRNLNDLLLIGLSMMVLVAFAFKRR